MNESHDDRITNPAKAVEQDSFSALCERRYSRRGFIKSGLVIGGATLGLGGCDTDQFEFKQKNKNEVTSNFDFIEIEHGIDETHHVAPDHDTQILLRWGDPIFDDAPEFDVNTQSAERQLRQFGYNNDFIGYIPLQSKKGQQARALLCVNHEYPLHGLMFPDFGDDDDITAEQVAISQASSGASIVEIGLSEASLNNRQWQINKSSKYNRRISALDSEIEISGPVARNQRLTTSADPEAETIIGTLNNCAGGITPWNTYLTCEENFNFYFTGQLKDGHPETQNYQRYNLGYDFSHWGKHDKRFDISVEPNEPNRFGWVVEIDSLDPSSIPKKRTALGRFKHEGAKNVIAADGRLVVYMGDDQRFEYLYKFVSRDKVDLNNRESNKYLLDFGTLFVAKFDDEGGLEWLPLSHNNKVLAAEFGSQADILIETRRAADLLGATPMDRPEDIVPNEKTGKVYVMLTNNKKRKETDSANPRANNKFGHIIEINEGGFYNTKAQWSLLVKCGDPSNAKHDAQWNANTSKDGWFASPDNGVIDPSGRLWVATDQGSKTNLSGTCDGLWAFETEGDMKGTGKMFFRVPDGAEMCGPAFSDDGENLFLSVQHPGDREELQGQTRIGNVSTTWPDFKKGVPPRPSVVVVRKKGGGVVG